MSSFFLIVFNREICYSRTLVFGYLILIIHSLFISYRIIDSLFFVTLLFSAIIIGQFYSLNDISKNKIYIIKLIFLLSLINLCVTAIEDCFKALSMNDVTIIKYVFYINKSTLGGLLYQPNLNAAFLNIGALISLFFFEKVTQTKTKKTIYIILYSLFFYYSINSGSRSSLVSMVFLSLLVIYLYKKNKIENEYYGGFIVFFLIYFCIFVFSLYFVRYNPISKIDIVDPENVSILSRINIWATQIYMIFKYPLGVGLDNFKYLNGLYQKDTVNFLKISYDNIGNFTLGHNEILQILAEIGMFVFVIFIILIKNIRVRKIDRDSIVSICILTIISVHSLFEWHFRHPFFMVLFFIFFFFLFEFKGGYKDNILTDDNKRFDFFKNIFVVSHILLSLYFICILIFEAIYIDRLIKTNDFYNKNSIYNKISYISKLSEPNTVFRQLYFASKYYKSNLLEQEFFVVTKEKFNRDKYNKFISIREKDNLIKELYFKSEKLVGVYKNWITFKLAAFFSLVVGDYDKADIYIRKSIELNPIDDESINMWHFISIIRHNKDYEYILQKLPSEKTMEELMREFDNEIKKKKNLSK